MSTETSQWITPPPLIKDHGQNFKEAQTKAVRLWVMAADMVGNTQTGRLPPWYETRRQATFWRHIANTETNVNTPYSHKAQACHFYLTVFIEQIHIPYIFPSICTFNYCLLFSSFTGHKTATVSIDLRKSWWQSQVYSNTNTEADRHLIS